MSEVAALTADSTALTDDKGTTVNPHERPAGEKHDENPTTCTDCHNNHSKDLPKDAMKYCAQCHHRGTFECGTCHELREPVGGSQPSRSLPDGRGGRAASPWPFASE